MYHRQNRSHLAINYVIRISCASTSNAVELPPSSPNSTDVINKFPLKACAAHNVIRNVDAANALAQSIQDLPKSFVHPPSVHDAAVSSFLQRQEDPPAKSNSKPRRSSPPSFSNASNINVSKHNALAENRGFSAYYLLLDSK